MAEFRLTLIRTEAEKRLLDAELLAGRSTSDSAYLLRLLGFELLLKCLVEATTGEAVQNHDYVNLFQRLKVDEQSRLLALVAERIGPSKAGARLLEVLKDFSSNFIDLRYPYSRYKGLTEAEYVKKGERWVAKGAPEGGAEFRYHPEELLGLVHALRLSLDSYGIAPRGM